MDYETSGNQSDLLNLLRQIDRRLERIEGDVAVLKGDVAVLKGDVAVLKGDVAVLKDDVEVLKVGQKANTEYLLKLIGDVDYLRAGQERFAHDQERVLNALQASGYLE